MYKDLLLKEEQHLAKSYVDTQLEGFGTPYVYYAVALDIIDTIEDGGINKMLELGPLVEKSRKSKKSINYDIEQLVIHELQVRMVKEYFPQAKIEKINNLIDSNYELHRGESWVEIIYALDNLLNIIYNFGHE